MLRFQAITAICCFISAAMLLTAKSEAQTYDRLPAVRSVAQLERLPSLEGPSSRNQLNRDKPRKMQFAGGSISIMVPNGWWAEEVPVGREIRLVIAPQRPANLRKMPADGMWLAYHAVPATQSIENQALMQELSIRLRSVVGGEALVSAPSAFEFNDWPAVVSEFTTSVATLANRKITGRHVLVRTDWGLFEFHASALDEVVPSRSEVWTETWDSLQLNAPTTIRDQLSELPSSSGGIVGNWKSYRSRMKFTDDGRVELIPDSVFPDETPTTLSGTYEARNDLIFVRWNDGSRLNFRWRLQGNDLFLTDHQGQISQLKRVFN